jgi:hypothetical protein
MVMKSRGIKRAEHEARMGELEMVRKLGTLSLRREDNTGIYL